LHNHQTTAVLSNAGHWEVEKWLKR